MTRSTHWFLLAAAVAALAACQAEQDPSTLVGPALSAARITGGTSEQARALVPQATLTPIITVGDVINGQPWAPTPDGLGAYRDGGDVVVFANHELSNGGIPNDQGAPGFQYSRVSRLVIDPSSFEVKQLTYPITGAERLLRLCSASWAGAEEGFPSGYFLTGEEQGGTENGSVALAVNAAGTAVTRLPWLGALAHENEFAVPFPGKVVVVTTDDSRGQAELYVYVAASEADVLAGAGKLYVFRTDARSAAGKPLHSGNMSVGQSIDGNFVQVADPADLGAAPAARFNRLQAKVDALGAMPFVRLEDGDYDRREGRARQKPAIYFVDTGSESTTGRTEVGADCGGVCDAAGSLYRLQFNELTDPTASATLTLLHRSSGAASGWASPDNISTSRKGMMVMEDPAYSGFSRAPGVWNASFRPDGTTGAFQEIVELINPTCHDGDSNPANECWESSGIITTASLLGEGTWLFDIQAHSLPFTVQNGATTVNYSREGGQLLYLRLPGS